MIDIVVRYDGRKWIASNEMLHAEAVTLEALDSKLIRLIKEGGYVEKGKSLKVFMAFDNSTIPTWMRQYAQHYFNRIIHVEG